jgi:hypothetical protein
VYQSRSVKPAHQIEESMPVAKALTVAVSGEIPLGYRLLYY